MIVFLVAVKENPKTRTLMFFGYVVHVFISTLAARGSAKKLLPTSF